MADECSSRECADHRFDGHAGPDQLELADVRSVMASDGQGDDGPGEASAENRAIEAAEKAFQPVARRVSLKAPRVLIISITGGEDMK